MFGNCASSSVRNVIENFNPHVRRDGESALETVLTIARQRFVIIILVVLAKDLQESWNEHLLVREKGVIYPIRNHRSF